MLSRSIRIALIVAVSGYGLFRVLSGAASGWLFLAAAAAFALGLFRNHSVALAYRAVLAGDTGRASVLLAQVPDSTRLSRQDRAYFHWVAGQLAGAAGQYREAYQHLSIAVSGGLRTSHLRAATECSLAEAALGLGDKPMARSHFERAQALPSRDTLKPVLAGLATRLGSA
jgi:hypothetical protein